MPRFNMLNERDIKAALIDKLFDRGMLDDAVLINEMVVANWNRRADLAVANGRLYAFEIKSDLDTLSRLEGQVSAYLGRFDKVIVVTTAKFSSTIASSVPEHVEIWEVSRNHREQAIGFRVIRRGLTREITCRDMLSGFLLKRELVSFLKSEGVNILGNSTRQDIMTHLRDQPVQKLRQHVLACLKNRYRTTFDTFMQQRGTQTTLADLDCLSKSKLRLKNNVEVLETKLITVARPPKKYHYFDLQNFAEKYGEVPECMPRGVLPRRHT